jgi:diphthamide biosynthesis methyltransferase
MLFIVGLGLADEKDVSVKGLEIIKRAERVYLEAYTAILLVDQQQLVRSAHESEKDDTDQPGRLGKVLWPVRHLSRQGDGRVQVR